MKIVHTILLLLFFSLPYVVLSQEYSYINYNSPQGLAGSTVYCIQQDKDGFLWIGTETGLSRFDGTHFINFSTADGLPDNEILKIFVDSKNRIWIIPFKNSVCYYWKGKIYNKDNDPMLKKINLTGDVIDVLEDRFGDILIQEAFTCNLIKTNGEIKIIKEVNHEPFQLFAVGINEKGTFSMALKIRKRISFFEMNGDNIEPLKANDQVYSTHASYTFILSPGLEVVRTSDSLIFFRAKDREVFSFRNPDNFVNMAVLNDSLFVINAAAKCMIYNLNQKKITGEFLDGHKVTAVLEDREKNLWFATMGEGIFRLGSTAFRNIRFNNNGSMLAVFSIYKWDSTIYIGTDYSFLWTFNRTTGNLQKHNISEGLQNARVLSMVADDNKTLIVGTDWGLYKYAHTVGPISELMPVKGMIFDRHKLIVAAGNSVNIISGIPDNRWDRSQIWTKRSTCVFPHENNFYIGSLNGLYEINAKGESVFKGEENKLLSNRISAITKTGDNIYWIATYGAGVIGLKDDVVVTHLTMENGLSSDICRNIFVSGDDLWIGTDKGLNKVERKEEPFRITKFTTTDGLASDIINAVYTDRGTVYVGTPQGLTYFDENNISQSSDCALHITAIGSSGHVWNFDTTGFLLKHRDNNIRFEFAGLSYRSAGDVTYQYRLLGLDSNWKTTRESFLSYPALPSGRYQLQLIGINKFGIQSDTRHIDFTIEELLEEKTWFRLLLILLGGGCIWLGVIYYIKTIRKKEAVKADTARKVTELEQMALKAQMNPHFIFNSLNSIQQYVMDKDTVGANKFITGFSSLIRQTLEFSSKQDISLQDELQYLATYLELEKTRMEDKFVYEIQLDPKIAVTEYYIPPMILQPFVENSIRHGIAYRKDKLGKISITINLQQARLVCIVEDNGVGRAVAGQFKKDKYIAHQSKGMSLTAARVEMFNNHHKEKIEMVIQDLKDAMDHPSGTRVIINFPV